MPADISESGSREKGVSFPASRFTSYPMEFVSMTRGAEIGANSYLLRSGSRSVVLDAGMHPKRSGPEALPDFSPLVARMPDCIVVTHAHQDHVGSLPVLTRTCPDVPVYMTGPTMRIADAMLHNSAHVMGLEQDEGGPPVHFTHRAVDLSRRSWGATAYRVPIGFSGERVDEGADASLEFYPAGHILGAAGVLIRLGGKRIFYTGDVNFENQTLIRGAEFPEENIDVLVMETTRGDSPTPAGFNRASEEDRLAESIRKGFETGGVMIPVFALGKTQEVLGMIWKMRLRGELPTTPLYIGGLSTKITTIYDAFPDDLQRLNPDLQLLHALAPYVLSGNSIHSTPVRRRSLYAVTSGMMTEKTVSNIFARKILGDPKQSLFFVGYSDPDSPAGKIRAASSGDRITLDSAKPELTLRCQVQEFQFSAHATRESLFKYAIGLRPRKILLVHGDRAASEWFQSHLFRELPDTEIIIPEPGRPVKL